MEHEASGAAFHQVVRAHGEGLNAALREELLALPGNALARTLIEQGERRYGPVSEETQAAQASLLETQERERQETGGIDWGEVDAAIEARDRAFAAQTAREAPSPAAAGRDAERWSALTPKERTAERQAGPEALPELLAKHDKNIARRAKERAFRQWGKEQEKSDPGFAERSSKEKRAAFNAEREVLSGADAAVAVVETVVAQEFEAQAFEERGPEPD